MGFVFVSYSRKDTDVVNTVVSRLRDDGFEVWIDRESIEGGDPWRKQIVRAIHGTDAFILMLSRNSIASDNVRKEVDLAENAKRKLFPVQLEFVEIPEDLQYQLAGIQWIEYHGNPEKKYQELVEVLRAHQARLAEARQPETRQGELVVAGVNLRDFGPKEQEALLSLIAQVTNTPRANLSLANLEAGSVRVFVNMPADAAYDLKTAALNRDKRLLKQGVTALRLDGEEKYVLVESGFLGFPKPKPPSSCLGRFLLGFIGAGVLLALLLGGFFVVLPYFRPEIVVREPSPTYTPAPKIEPSETSTPPPSRTPRPTVTQNVPPPAPEIVAPQDQSTVYCDQNPVYLEWTQPSDASGISQYELSLDVFMNDQWSNLISQPVDGTMTTFEITREIHLYCGSSFRWQVRALDGEGTLGEWSMQPSFQSAPFIIGVVPRNVPPPAPSLDIKADGRVENSILCYPPSLYHVELVWIEPYDADGIDTYQVQLQALLNNQWVTILDRTTPAYAPYLDITPEVNNSKYCGTQFQATIRAMDKRGAWGNWSPWFRFQTLQPPG